MSRILEVAKAFEKKSQEEVRNTDIIVSNVIKQHESDLMELLQGVRENLSNVIQAEQKKLSKRLRRIFSIASIGALALMLTAAGAITIWGIIEYNKAAAWRRSAEHYQTISKSLNITRCQVSPNQSRYCIEIDPNYKGKYWGDGNMAILPINTEN